MPRAVGTGRGSRSMSSASRRGQGRQVRRQVVAHQADVVHALAALGQEAGHAALRVRWLHQLDARGAAVAGRQEAESDALLREVERGSLGPPAEEALVARQRLVDRAHHDGDVVDGPMVTADTRPRRHAARR